MASSKKGISSNQLHRTLGVTLKTAWFMSHRIREAMRVLGVTPLGGAGEVVEVDETYIGRVRGAKVKQGSRYHKHAVLSLVDRKNKQVRSFHIAGTTINDIAPILRANIAKDSRLVTDQAPWYRKIGAEFASHESVDHAAEEYVRGDVTTNTVEGYYSIFKRGMTGVYQHCAEKHLHRYLAEFDFRYSNRVRLGVNDVARADRTLKGIVGKRLTYRTPNH